MVICNICKKEYLHIELYNSYIETPKKFKEHFMGCLDARNCFLKYLDNYCK